MKKLSDSMLAAMLLVEIIITAGLVKLTEQNQILWVVGGILVLVIGATTYLLMMKSGKRLSEYKADINLQCESFQTILRENMSEIKELVDTKLEKYDDILDEMQKNVKNVMDAFSDFRRKYLDMVEEEHEDLADNLKKILACQKDYASNAERLCAAQEAFMDDLHKSSTESIKTLNVTITESYQKVSGMLEEQVGCLTRELSEEAKQSKERFVKWSDALADAQKNNAEAITQAYNKMSELAEVVMRAEKGIEKITDMFLTTVNSTREIIEKGNLDFGKNWEEFSEEFGEIFDSKNNELKKVIDKRLERYDDIFDKMNVNIKNLVGAFQKNVIDYQKVLDRIVSTQNAMKELTSRDVQLLEKMMGR